MDGLNPPNVNPINSNSSFGSASPVAWLESVDETRRVCIPSSDGELLSGHLYASWSLDEWRQLSGRVADLKNAYKQLAIHTEHASFSIIAVWDPVGRKTALFKALASMLGQTAAVYSFLRVTRALAPLCSELLSLLGREIL